jgi:hypothetical protein
MITNRKGSALVSVLIAMLVLSIMAVAVLSTSLADTKHAVYHQDSIQSYYLARSAVDDVASYIISNKTAPSLTLPTQKSFSFGSYTVDKLQASAGNTVYYIEATGTINNNKKTVGLTLSKANPSDLFQHAIYTYSNLNIEQMVVSGDIASSGTIDYAKNGSNAYNTSLYTAYPGHTLDTVYSAFPIPDTYKNTSGPDLVVNKTEEIISSNINYNSITVSNDATSILRFNTGSEGDILTVGVIDMDILGQQSKIIVDGDGLLKLYIYGTLSSKTNLTVADGAELELFVYQNATAEFQTPISVNENEDPNKIRIYLDKDSLLDLQANGNYNAYIQGPEAFIKMQSSDTTINGAIIGNILQGMGSKPSGKVNYKAPDDSWSLYYATFNKRFYQ